MTYKIYTKLGDKGKTSIIGQNRINKHDIRVEAYGSIDELNSYLGLLRSYDEIKKIKFLYNFLIEYKINFLILVHTLLKPKKKEKNKEFLISKREIINLENIIDEIENKIPSITRFVLPGGNVISSHFQIARAICRRSERRITFFNEKEKLDNNLLIYINRLSDFYLSLHVLFYIILMRTNFLGKVN